MTVSLIFLFAVLATSRIVPDASAQQDRLRVFVMAQGADDVLRSSVDDAMSTFSSVLTGTGEYAIATTVEMDRVVAECRAEAGVSPEEERRCRLVQARRAFVAYVAVIEARRLGGQDYELTMEVVDPDAQETVFVSTATASGPALLAVREALSSLAEDFVSWQRTSESGARGYVEVMQLSGVSTATVCINGDEVGPAPGQFPVEAGPARIEVGAVGHLPFAREVIVPANGLYEMPEVPLEPITAVIHVSSNVHQARITIDGGLVGSTHGNGSVRFELEPGRHEVVVERNGWQRYSRTVDLAPAEYLPVAANLAPAR